jgi:hypothetical protein
VVVVANAAVAVTAAAAVVASFRSGRTSFVAAGLSRRFSLFFSFAPLPHSLARNPFRSCQKSPPFSFPHSSSALFSGSIRRLLPPVASGHCPFFPPFLFHALRPLHPSLVCPRPPPPSRGRRGG